MRILVTGCCGFIGSHIYNKLIEEGHEVFGIDDLSGGDISNIENQDFLHCFDLSQKSRTLCTIKMINPDICFHLAASAREIGSLFEPAYSTETNYYAYMNVLSALIQCSNFKKMILFSSIAVYGHQEPPFSEDFPRQPEDVYGVNKASMEHSTEILSDVHGFDYVIIRAHNVFGEHQCLIDRFRNVFAIFMNHIMRKEPITIFGDGYQERAPSYIDFSLPCYLKCIEPEINKEIINIGGIESYHIKVISDMVIDAMCSEGWKRPIVNYADDRPREVKRAFTTWQKSVDLLGYEENKSLYECILKMATWATKKGPQQWTADKFEIYNDKVPEIWRD
jgi:UDP-glucose 4-epimerase